MVGTGTTAELKRALVGTPDATFVWLCNFEAENQWATGYVGLPAAPLSATAATVRRLEELGAMLAEPGDHLLLGRPMDAGFRRYAEDIGLPMPAELTVDAGDAATSEAVLACPDMLSRLRELAAAGAYLMPMGCSAREQEISRVSGLPLAVPDADLFERVNSKIYSRRLVAEIGLREIPGYCCESTDELRTALGSVLHRYGQAIVKDAYGVSGKGLVIVDSQKKADRVLRMVDQRTRRTGSTALHVVVERLLDKRFDLNYQFTIDRAGAVRFDFVKQAIVEKGVHKGHVMPAALTPTQHDELVDAAERIGKRLHTEGFVGVVGVDALLATDDVVYPVVEINARLNMSTFQQRMTERFQGPAGFALARHYSLRATRPVAFAEIRRALGSCVDVPAVDDGVVLTCFGTVNAQAGGAGDFVGRLYATLFARSRAALDELGTNVAGRLAALETEMGATE